MLNICRQFQLSSPVLSCEPHGNGHINSTYRIHTEDGADYILQRISRQAFHDIPALMRNISQVTAFLARQDSDPRHSLQLIPTVDGENYLMTPDGDAWRVYAFIGGGVCLDAPERPSDLFECAYAFGRFQKALGDFPAKELSETIPRFHDTPNRYTAFRAAIESDALGRAASCQEEIAFALAREQEAACLMNQLHQGVLPLRVTHNDTKLNNVMLDAETHKGLCVLDLDTVMPGLAAFDFGDLVRFGASTGAEDEKDLSRIGLSLDNYAQLLDGFLSACGDSLTAAEIASLPMGAKLMTLECGVRFLTDYLMGDVYFHIQRPEHNLDRCRTQFKLVASMEDNWAAMLDRLPKAQA